MPRTVEEITAELRTKPIERSFVIERGVEPDEETRTVNLAFASDQPIEHWFGSLALSMKKGAMRTDRLENGAALLMDHNTRDQIGVVENFEIKGGMARADVRFSTSARGEEIFQDVKTGIRRNVSVGFMVHEMHLESEKKGETPVYRSDDWEPYEISIVSIPADTGVGVGRDAEKALEVPETRAIPNTPEKTMAKENEETPGASPVVEQRSAAAIEIERTREIVDFATIFGFETEARAMLAASPSVTLEDVRTAIKAKQPPTVTVPVMDTQTAAERGGAGPQTGIQLARTLPRYGTLRNFTGPDAAERAHRFGQWVLGIRGISSGLSAEGGFARAAAFCKENGIVLTRAMSEGVNESGGFLVPEEFGNDLIDLREIYGVFRKNAKMVPMSSDTRSDPRRTGGLTAYFAGEGDALTASDKAWDRVELTAKKLTTLSRYSNELNEDAVINMADDLAGEIAYAFALKEDQCGFIGDGTSTYGGMQGVCTKIKGLSATIANIAGLVVGSGNAYSEQVLTDFEAVAAKLPVYADTPRAKWYCHKSFYWNVMVKLALAAGGATGAETTGGVAKRFLGYDVEFVQVMPSVEANSQVCALLGDLSLAASFGSRRDTTIAISEHSRFANDQLEIRGTERFDINVHDVGNQSSSAGSRVPGPIVGLITAAS
jgi:HK97 family phage major capsid protein/HK97 family phage prohead protease